MTKDEWIAWDRERMEMGFAPLFPANGAQPIPIFERHISFYMKPPTEEPGWSIAYYRNQLIAVHPNHPPHHIPLNWEPLNA